MSYVLDGIKTALEAFPVSSGLHVTHEILVCPCGWEAETSRDPHDLFTLIPYIDALRFHYTHCPQARPAQLHGETE